MAKNEQPTPPAATLPDDDISGAGEGIIARRQVAELTMLKHCDRFATGFGGQIVPRDPLVELETQYPADCAILEELDLDAEALRREFARAKRLKAHLRAYGTKAEREAQEREAVAAAAKLEAERPAILKRVDKLKAQLAQAEQELSTLEGDALAKADRVEATRELLPDIIEHAAPWLRSRAKREHARHRMYDRAVPVAKARLERAKHIRRLIVSSLNSRDVRGELEPLRELQREANALKLDEGQLAPWERKRLDHLTALLSEIDAASDVLTIQSPAPAARVKKLVAEAVKDGVDKETAQKSAEERVQRELDAGASNREPKPLPKAKLEEQSEAYKALCQQCEKELADAKQAREEYRASIDRRIIVEGFYQLYEMSHDAPDIELDEERRAAVEDRHRALLGQAMDKVKSRRVVARTTELRHRGMKQDEAKRQALKEEAARPGIKQSAPDGQGESAAGGGE